MGKARLALQAAADYIRKYRMDVVFVPLVALASTKFIIPAIAEALRLEWDTGEDLLMQLCDALAEQTLLLVLDNFEHLVEGAWGKDVNYFSRAAECAGRMAYSTGWFRGSTL